MLTEKEFEKAFDRYIICKHLPIRKVTKPNGDVVYLGIRLKTKEERRNHVRRKRTGSTGQGG